MHYALNQYGTEQGVRPLKIKITQFPNGFCIKLIIKKQDTWPTRKGIKIHFSLKGAGPVPGPRENPEQFDLCKYQNLHVSTHFSNTCLGTGL